MPATTITVAQQKGGAGKTMLAANLAACWAGAHRVALLDIDPQASLTRWHAGRAARNLIFSGVSGWRLRGELERLAREADILLIDTPPHVEADAARAIRAAQLVLVPIQPSMPDLWAAEGTLRLAASEGKRVAMVLNRTPAKSRLRSVIEAELTARGLPLLPVALANRTAYAQAFAQGMGVAEMARAGVAGAEMHAVAAAVLEAAQA